MRTVLLLYFISISIYAQPKVNTTEIYVCPPCRMSCDTITFKKPGICPHCNMKLITKEELQKRNSKKKKIAFYLQPEVEILDFAGPMEVFAYANFDVFTVSKTTAPILSQGILKIIPDYSIDNAPKADILAFFGGNAPAAYEDPEVISWITSQDHVSYHFSVCTGAFILAKSGVLSNKTATTFHNALNGLEREYPDINVVKNARFVDNGKVITTAGISAGIDGALHLVAKLRGFNEARKIAYHMEYDKWIPGEGLLLSNENPYKELENTALLQKYIGTYEYFNENKTKIKIELKINTREKSLYAVIDNMNYPLLHIEDNIFTNIVEHKIIFHTHEEKVTGFTSSKYADTFFKKL